MQSKLSDIGLVTEHAYFPISTTSFFSLQLQVPHILPFLFAKFIWNANLPLKLKDICFVFGPPQAQNEESFIKEATL